MSLRQKQFYEAYYNYKLNGPVGDEEEKDEKRRKQNTSAGISQSEMVSCLQDFGTANNERTFGFLTFKAIERDLHRINGLEKYKTLQTVLLSKNFITNIAPLSDLRLLTKIDVSENEISSIENLDELLYLESFNLSKNLLTEMPNFAKFRHLSTLDLSHNAISQIDGVRDNVALKVLKLSGNNIEVIKNLDYMNLTELYLDQNNIVQLCNLNTLKKLRALDCSRNKISKLKGLKLLDSLRFLYLSANKIQKIREVHWLSNLNCLTCLDLCHNPLLSKRFYRIQVIYVLQHLRSLDGQKLTAEERENADNFFGKSNLHVEFLIFGIQTAFQLNRHETRRKEEDLHGNPP